MEGVAIVHSLSHVSTAAGGNVAELLQGDNRSASRRPWMFGEVPTRSPVAVPAPALCHRTRLRNGRRIRKFLFAVTELCSVACREW